MAAIRLRRMQSKCRSSWRDLIIDFYFLTSSFYPADLEAARGRPGGKEREEERYVRIAKEGRPAIAEIAIYLYQRSAYGQSQYPRPSTPSSSHPLRDISELWYVLLVVYVRPVELNQCMSQASSGVGLSGDCTQIYNDLKLGKKHKYIIYNLSKDVTEIVVEKTSASTNYDEFIADLPEKECRWAVYDFEYERDDGGKRNKLVFIAW